MKKTKLRPRSKKRAGEWALYLKKRAEFLRKNPFCEVLGFGCWIHAVDVHHMKRRTGKLLNNTRYWLPVCRTCHQWIEDNKREARKLGYILYK